MTDATNKFSKATAKIDRVAKRTDAIGKALTVMLTLPIICLVLGFFIVPFIFWPVGVLFLLSGIVKLKEAVS